MPPVQSTFTLIPQRPVIPGGVPTRPMTSKQIKKAYRESTKQPRMSRAEARKMELAEQERIRKEYEKERMAARARAARDRKKAKEEAQREARRKSGKPLVDVRPSQDTISKFLFRGNMFGRKRDDKGGDVDAAAMDTIPEITSDRESMPPELVCQETADAGSPAFADDDEYDIIHGETSMVKKEIKKASLPRERVAVEQENEGRGMALEHPIAAGSPYDDEQNDDLDNDNFIPSKRPRLDIGPDDDDDNPFLTAEPSLGKGELCARATEEPNRPIDDKKSSAHSQNSQALASDDGDQDDFFDGMLEDDLDALLGTHSATSTQESTTPLPPPKVPQSPTREPATPKKGFSSFTEGSLDDDTLCQLMTPQPHKRQSTETASVAIATTRSILESVFDADDNSALSPQRRQQPPPLSTQACLLKCDDYFPTPSQQERELEGDVPPRTTQPSPCPATSYGTGGAAAAGISQKRFFSASGSNQLLSLAVQRSKRSAALDDIRQFERWRCDAETSTRPPLQNTRPQQHMPVAATMAPPPTRLASRVPPAYSAGPNRSRDSPPLAAKSVKTTPPQGPSLDDKENDNPRLSNMDGPPASQESEYGGLWIDELACDFTIDDGVLLAGSDNPRLS
ncbi:hypothetical protein GMORB2_4485 [Geosmithia morbida]|uniref:Uncharacterized protein n=1 Tax=Geosmithia morbida TaxID=1094350 RepID=A0A9P4YRR7_9HYPO|nr:uncharacterized protein GMORB2_4485 [Geosmithia morbida]KAF4119819.1 hypothetical protein GMORB2_4485 [Geosmithia morbida]